MKRVILVVLSIFCSLLSFGLDASAQIITHSVYGSLSSYTPVDPHTTVIINDPQMTYLFDVTFDDSAAFYSTYDSGGGIVGTTAIADSFFPNSAFMSDASFTFSPYMISMFSLLGIAELPAYPTISYVMGIEYETEPEATLSYQYIFSYNGGIINFAPDPQFSSYEDQVFPIDSSGKVYDSFSFNIDTMTFDFGNNAQFCDVQYTVSVGSQAPAPAPILLLGTGLVGLAGLRRQKRNRGCSVYLSIINTLKKFDYL